MKALIQWLAGMLSANEQASFGRFASLLSLVFCLGWDTAYVVFTIRHFGQFHFAASDLLAYSGVLMAQGGFCTLFYGTSKGLDVLGKATTKDVDPNQPKG